PQRGQHLQAAGGLLRRDADRPMRPEGADGGRRPGQREACGLCHQPGRRHLRRREGADPPDPGAGLCAGRRPAGAGGPDHRLRKGRCGHGNPH
ncbi:hypothetical protein ICNMLN_ICNMLN_16620, partial [Dysosmobacter welbionis]